MIFSMHYFSLFFTSLLSLPDPYFTLSFCLHSPVCSDTSYAKNPHIYIFVMRILFSTPQQQQQAESPNHRPVLYMSSLLHIFHMYGLTLCAVRGHDSTFPPPRAPFSLHTAALCVCVCVAIFHVCFL